MTRLSRYMIGYGAILVACGVIESTTLVKFGLHGKTLAAGWAGGTLMLAAGLAVMQGRTSLRAWGLFLGLLLPLVMAGTFTWQSADTWRDVRAGTAETLEGVLCSGLAVLSVVATWIFNRVRPREGIATRGYAIHISPTSGEASPPKPIVKPASRRSEAG